MVIVWALDIRASLTLHILGDGDAAQCGKRPRRLISASRVPGEWRAR